MRTVFALLGGIVIGAAAALLLAPEKGEVTRKIIKDKVGDGVGSMKDSLSSLRERLSKEVDELEDTLQDTRVKVNQAARKGIKTAADKVKVKAKA